MSKFYAAADLIATRLSSLPELDGISVVVDRQKDLTAELRKAIGKQNGAGLVVVTWAGAKNKDKDAEGPYLENSYTVHFLTKPVIRAGETPADDIMEAMATGLHDYSLAPTAPYSARVMVTEIDLIPHEELLIYQLSLTNNLQL